MQQQANQRARERGDGQQQAPTKTLEVLYLNAQSLVTKVNELHCTVSDLEPDVVLVTETWCKSEINNAYLGLNGYEPDLRLDRSDTDRGRGGRLLVYTKIGLQILSCNSGVDFVQHCKLW